jgi:hypothetical protein
LDHRKALRIKFGANINEGPNDQNDEDATPDVARRRTTALHWCNPALGVRLVVEYSLGPRQLEDTMIECDFENGSFDHPLQGH